MHPTLFAIALTAALLAQSSETKTLGIDEIVSRVQANVEKYNASLPDLICHERRISGELHKGKLKRTHQIDSELSLVRKKIPDAHGSFEESRTIKLIDGKISQTTHVKLPLGVTDAIVNSLNSDFGVERAKCYSYSFLGTEKLHEQAVFVIGFTEPLDISPLSSRCQHTPGATGKAWIDAESMQVLRTERRDPDRPDLEHATVTWSVEYSPVSFGGTPFWVPKTVSSDLRFPNKPEVLQYRAEYSNYHKFGVTSKILPAADSSNEN